MEGGDLERSLKAVPGPERWRLGGFISELSKEGYKELGPENFSSRETRPKSQYNYPKKPYQCVGIGGRKSPQRKKDTKVQFKVLNFRDGWQQELNSLGKKKTRLVCSVTRDEPNGGEGGLISGLGKESQGWVGI